MFGSFPVTKKPHVWYGFKGPRLFVWLTSFAQTYGDLRKFHPECNSCSWYTVPLFHDNPFKVVKMRCSWLMIIFWKGGNLNRYILLLPTSQTLSIWMGVALFKVDIYSHLLKLLQNHAEIVAEFYPNNHYSASYLKSSNKKKGVKSPQ